MRIKCLAFGVVMFLLGIGSLRAQSISAEQPDQLRRAGKTLVFAAPGGDLGKVLKGLLADFSKDTGIRVNYLEGPLLDLYGRVKAEWNRPSIDVYVASSVTETKGIHEGMYQKLDPKIVTHMREVLPVGLAAGGYGVRMGLTSLGIIYNRKVYEQNHIPAPTSWDDIWNPAVSGHVILGDTTSFYTVLYIASITKRLGGEVSNPAPGIDYLAERKHSLLAVVRTYPERMQMLNSGQAWLTVDVGMSSVPETRKNPDLAFVSPEQGSALFWNCYTVVKGAPNPVGAHLLINYMISAPAQARLARDAFLGPVNRQTTLDPELAAAVPYGAERIGKLLALDNSAIGDALGKYRELWDAKMAH
jgi:putative spermidine/putrescine transport system substrate-binding protein